MTFLPVNPAPAWTASKAKAQAKGMSRSDEGRCMLGLLGLWAVGDRSVLQRRFEMAD